MFRVVIVAGILFSIILALINPWLLVLLAIVLLCIGIHDRLQTQHGVRNTHPILGWFRYMFESVGPELRQWWFLADHEVRPYDREKLAYVYRSAKALPNSIGFGTERDYASPGQIHMLPSMFPIPEHKGLQRCPVLIVGPKRRYPMACPSVVNISGMSFGALSEEAVRALSSGALLADIHMSTGEGGLTPYHLEGVKQKVPWGSRIARTLSFGLSFANGRFRRAPLSGKTIGGGRIIAQIGPAKFSYRTETGELDWAKLKKVGENPQIVAFEIKLAQGAKPGQGGLLPKAKITAEIAKIRGVPMDRDCLSPAAFDEFNDVPSMMEFIKKVQELTGKPVGIKIVVGRAKYIEELASYMAEKKEGPDFITIDGGEGGTGSAPLPLADMMGLPILHALPLVDNILRQHNVRNDVTLVASGKIATSGDIAVHLAMGADLINIGRGFLFSLGCIQAQACHTNKCPTGITTQDPRYRRGLNPLLKYVRVANYAKTLQKEVMMIVKSVGVRTPWDLRRHHVSIIVEPGKELSMADRFPYPQGDDGKRYPKLKD